MSDEAPSHISPFERIRHTMEAGDEYWSARELMTVLGYAKWQRFREAIQRAVIACVNSGQEPADHFTGTGGSVDGLLDRGQGHMIITQLGFQL